MSRSSATGRRGGRGRGADEQLVFELPHRQALDAEDFLVSPASETAVAMIDRWPDWPLWAVVLVGAERSGKSHLVNVWRTRSRAPVVAASELGPASVSLLRGAGALAVEDIDRGLADEDALFHLLNVAREHRLTVLLTSRVRPGEIALTLPDLRSRIRALPLTEIGAPDERLLQALLVKFFDDRQLQVDPAVIDQLVRHMDRSTAAAHRLVERIDRLALTRNQRVTRALAAEALAAEEDLEP